MWYLSVTGKPVADMAALIGGNRLWMGTIERDRELIEKIVDIARPFWEDTQAGIPPVIDGSEASDQYLRLMYRDTGAEREMTDELAFMCRDYEALRLRIKSDEAQRDVIGNQIREQMGDARFATGDGVKVTWSEVKGRTSIDWPAVVGELSTDPQPVIDKHTTRADPGRQLRVQIKEG
jgi:predicted phage-related endonuclease